MTMMIHGACDVHELGLHFVAMLGYVEGYERQITIDLGDMTDADLAALRSATATEQMGRRIGGVTCGRRSLPLILRRGITSISCRWAPRSES